MPFLQVALNSGLTHIIISSIALINCTINISFSFTCISVFDSDDSDNKLPVIEDDNEIVEDSDLGKCN